MRCHQEEDADVMIDVEVKAGKEQKREKYVPTRILRSFQYWNSIQSTELA